MAHKSGSGVLKINVMINPGVLQILWDGWGIPGISVYGICVHAFYC